jgi:hypothetical protein
VGTASPSYRLHIVRSGDGITAGIAGGTYGIRFDNGGTFSSGMSTIHGVNETLTGSYQPIMLNGSDVRFGTSATERARITSGGELLIGTTSAKSRFVVDGGQVSVGSVGAGGNGIYLYINDALSDNSYMSRGSAGNGTTTWYIGNQTITTSSDRRLKANIRPTERNAVELLRQWEIVDHEWNDPTDQCENNKNSRGTWTGVIAQQVQQVTPWLVNKPLTDNDKDGTINPWVMDFGYAVPLLVKAIQEQQSMIDELKTKVAALEGV